MSEESERVKYLLKYWSHLQLAREYEQLENIIKEVREYIHWRLDNRQDMYITQMVELLEILDKAEENK